MKKLAIEIWSDIACPWCYVGKRRLEAALARFPHRDDVEVAWRSFELDTLAPRVRDPRVPYAQRLAAKYATSPQAAESMIRSMTATAAADGLDFHFEKIRPGNTFDAHRLVHFAAERGLGGAAKERLLRAYLSEGEAIGELDVLVRLGAEIGLPADEVEATLASDDYAEAVRNDEAEAQLRGIRGVPFFVFGGTLGISGAQPADVLVKAMEDAWERLPELPAAEFTEGATCGPEGCG